MTTTRVDVAVASPTIALPIGPPVFLCLGDGTSGAETTTALQTKAAQGM
jgi:hypothetical protein